MEVRLGFAEFDALVAPIDVRVGWCEFDAQAAPFGVYLGWCEFDNRSDGAAVPKYVRPGHAYYNPGQMGRYESRTKRNYEVPVDLADDADEAEEEQVVMALLMEIAARELA